MCCMISVESESKRLIQSIGRCRRLKDPRNSTCGSGLYSFELLVSKTRQVRVEGPWVHMWAARARKQSVLGNQTS